MANVELKAEINEEMLEVAEEATYEGLIDTEEVMVDVVVKISLVSTPLVSPSGDGIVSMHCTQEKV